jgi:hypothetical protein
MTKRTILFLITIAITFSSFSQNRKMLDVKQGFNIFKIGNKLNAYSNIITVDDYKKRYNIPWTEFLLGDYFYIGNSITHIGETPIRYISFLVDSKKAITTIYVGLPLDYSVDVALRSLYGDPQYEKKEVQSCGATLYTSYWKTAKIDLQVSAVEHKTKFDSDNCLVPDQIRLIYSNISENRQDIKDYNDKINRIKNDF